MKYTHTTHYTPLWESGHSTSWTIEASKSHSSEYILHKLYDSFSVKWNGIEKNHIAVCSESLDLSSNRRVHFYLFAIFQSSIFWNAISWTYLYELTFSSLILVHMRMCQEIKSHFRIKYSFNFVEHCISPFLCNSISISLDGMRYLIPALHSPILLGIILARLRLLSYFQFGKIRIDGTAYSRRCCLDVAKRTFYDRRGVERNRVLVTNNRTVNCEVITTSLCAIKISIR